MGTVRLDYDMTCPICNAKLDSLTPIPGEDRDIVEYREGSIAVCIHCGAVNIITKEIQLRSITEDELTDLSEKYPEEFALVMKASIVARHLPKNNN